MATVTYLTEMTTGPTQGPKIARPNPTILVAVTVTVVILAVVVGTIVIALVVGGLVYKRHQRKKYSPRSSSSSMSEETIDYYNMSGRPNGVTIEMKEQEPFEDPLDVPFEPSGSVNAENFKDHVEKYDVKRQLLFQEEFEVRSKDSGLVNVCKSVSKLDLIPQVKQKYAVYLPPHASEQCNVIGLVSVYVYIYVIKKKL